MIAIFEQRARTEALSKFFNQGERGSGDIKHMESMADPMDSIRAVQVRGHDYEAVITMAAT